MSQIFPSHLSSTRLLLLRLQRDDAERLIEAQCDREPGVPGTWLQLALVERATELLAGDCGLDCREDDPPQMEIGITLAPGHQGHGYATEALGCLLHFVFGAVDMHQVSAVTDAENHTATLLFRRLGLRQEAHHVEHRWHKGIVAAVCLCAVEARVGVTLTAPFGANHAVHVHCEMRFPALSVKQPQARMKWSTSAQMPKPPHVTSCSSPVPILPA